MTNGSYTHPHGDSDASARPTETALRSSSSKPRANTGRKREHISITSLTTSPARPGRSQQVSLIYSNAGVALSPRKESGALQVARSNKSDRGCGDDVFHCEHGSYKPVPKSMDRLAYGLGHLKSAFSTRHEVQDEKENNGSSEVVSYPSLGKAAETSKNQQDKFPPAEQSKVEKWLAGPPQKYATPSKTRKTVIQANVDGKMQTKPLLNSNPHSSETMEEPNKSKTRISTPLSSPTKPTAKSPAKKSLFASMMASASPSSSSPSAAYNLPRSARTATVNASPQRARTKNTRFSVCTPTRAARQNDAQEAALKELSPNVEIYRKGRKGCAEQNAGR